MRLGLAKAPIMQNPQLGIERATRLQGVRRRLFQDDDKVEENSSVEDNYMNCLYEETRKTRENAKRRWNFDFEKEEPLPGRYEWVKVDEDFKSETRGSIKSTNGGTGEPDCNDPEDEETENLPDNENTKLDNEKAEST